MRPHDSMRLRQIVEVRTIQSKAAELQAGLAAGAVHRAEAERQSAIAASDAALDGWLRTVGDVRHGADLAPNWGNEVRRREAELATSDEKKKVAMGDKERREADWRTALARADAADVLLRRASRREARLRSEAELGEVADRFAQRRGGR